MKPVRSKEPTRCGIRRAKSPQEHPLLAGVVWVTAPGGRKAAYIRFSEDLVDEVGNALPYGVSAEHPAFLKLVQYPSRGVWRLYAMYLDRSRSAFLWEYNEQPSWLLSGGSANARKSSKGEASSPGGGS